MFDIKCINCEFFDSLDGCKKGLEDENCNSFSPTKKGDEGQAPACKDCVWLTNGFCDFDQTDPTVCRRFKSLKEDL